MEDILDKFATQVSQGKLIAETQESTGSGMALITRQNNKRLFIGSSSSHRGGGKTKKITSLSKKKNHCGWRPWEDLPEDLIYLILSRLNLVDYFSFGGVCRRWRLMALANKQNYAASLPPLIVILTLDGPHFYNLFKYGGTTCLILPYAGISCSASSCGYLIAQVFCPPSQLLLKNPGPCNVSTTDPAQIWLINPITRHIYRFPFPPHELRRVIIASSSSIRGQRPWPSSQDALVIVSVCIHSSIQFYWSRDAKWTVHLDIDNRRDIVDIATFKGKIYYLTREFGLGTLKLAASHHHPVLVPLEVNKNGCFTRHNGYLDVELVASDEQLLMVVYLEIEVINVYELDLLKVEWRRVDRFGQDEALFTSSPSLTKFSVLVKNPGRWGGHGNCIYHFVSGKRGFVYSLDGKVLQSFSIPLGETPLWYFPYQPYSSIDSLYEDEEEE